MKIFRMVDTTGGMSKLLLSCIVGICGYAVLLQSRYLQDLSRTKAHRHILEPPKRRHDSSSKFSIMRMGGLLYNERQTSPPATTTTTSSNLVLDTLSIGTQNNVGLLEAQSRTWASHKSIRHYFAATEIDDADPTCYKTLNKTTIDNIVNLCVNEQPLAKGEMRTQYQKFSKGKPGWICAQQRFAVALETLGRFYRRELNAVENFTLPDFLLMQDDDSYYNMIRIEEFLKDKDPEIPLAEAPCLIRHTILRNFSFPWGGKRVCGGFTVGLLACVQKCGILTPFCIL